MSTSTPRTHTYSATTTWVGDLGEGTRTYRAYSRNHVIQVPGKPVLTCSSDPAFRGDPARHNPEELLVASLSGCHMLWVLHLCAEAGIVVTGYVDEASGTMVETEDGGGRFTAVTLRPRLEVAAGADVGVLEAIHQRAHTRCFIASSMNFPVACEAQVSVAPGAAPSA